MAAANPNTVVVLHNGSPVEMPWLGKVRGVVEAYLGGQAVGLATVRVLFGDVNPSGHLPETFPKKLADNPSYLYYVGEYNDVDYREGVFVGYRYYDRKEMDVLFPFGYGLSYTTFEYSGLKLSADHITDQDTVTATVTVKNTGSRAGKTVVQLYVAPQGGEIIRPTRELKGFEKVELQPGESREVSFTLCKRAFAYWNTQLHDWHVETGRYAIEIGQSSRDICQCAEIQVDSTVARPRPPYSMDSIMLDILDDPKAAQAFQPLFDAVGKALSGGEDANEAAQEAVSADMMMAMMRYMPLRGIMSFGQGAISEETIQALLDQINA